jgi:mannosyl-3-phosphoglycerate phosphatase family protein
MLPARLLIFTDLDGTLLDHQTYSWAAADEALAEIERRRVPLVFVTSKTRAEVEVLRRKMGHAHPFITENGGGIFIPDGYFSIRLEGASRLARYFCIALGRPYAEVCATLDELAKETGVEVAGFHHMRAREIAQNTGLSLKEAELAAQRDFDEPFFFAGASDATIQSFEQAAKRRGFQLARGGRFWHLFAGSDKGRATRQLAELYCNSEHARLRSVGLGDSPNDLPLLAAVDRPILLPGPNGGFAPEVLQRIPRIVKATEPGPAGWNAAVLRLLSEH